MRTGDFRNSFVVGPPDSVAAGPVLASAKYPDVLVAKAFSRGVDLELVLYPGAGSGSQTITIERLRAGGEYGVEGSDRRFRADEQGVASIDVELGGRTLLRVTPRN